MTNFEYLVKTDTLASYISSIFARINPIRDGYTDYAISCAEWLTSEHKTIKYVALDGVLSEFMRPMKVDSLKSTFSDTEVYHLIAENCCDIRNAILKLETKEIDE